MSADPAAGRFALLQLVRLSGALLALAGAVVASGRFPAIPPGAGLILVGAGLVDFFALPPLLARRWKSRP